MSEIQVKKPSPEELERLGVNSWGTWGCDVSRFDWHYDATETCYLLEGEVTVETEGGQTQIQAGDLVVFPQGLSCVWDVKAPVRKHFKFD
jgi:hypothetical protein